MPQAYPSSSVDNHFHREIICTKFTMLLIGAVLTMFSVLGCTKREPIAASNDEDDNLEELSCRPSTAVAYIGDDSDVQKICFTIDEDRLTRISVWWFWGNCTSGSGREGDSLPMIQDDGFMISDVLGHWTLSGGFVLGRSELAGNWLAGPGIECLGAVADSGEWRAVHDAPLFTFPDNANLPNDTIVLKVGEQGGVNMYCGLEPYQILNSPDPDVATIDDALLGRTGVVQITGGGVGNTSLMVGDCSTPQLTATVNVIVSSN